MAAEASERTSPGVLDLDRAILELISRRAVPIPPYPAVALRVQEIVSRNAFGLLEVARIVRADATLAANVLRCANSAVYRRGAPVSDLNQAVTRVGAQEVMRLALSSGLAAHALAMSTLTAVKRVIWIESVASAIVCHELARGRALRAEEAYVVGLLHDFGKVVACTCLETILESGDARARPLRTWAALAEKHHVTLGVQLADRWGLPALIKGIISDHHDPAVESCPPGLLEVVKASDEVSALLTTRTHVTVFDLVSMRSPLRAGEPEAIARLLEKIPGFIAAFEAPEAPAATSRRSQVEFPDTTTPSERRVRFPVSVRIARATREYTARSIATNGLVVLGKDPLPESRLFETFVQSDPKPFTMWALTRASRPTNQGVQVELQPYALAGEVRGLWNQLITTA